MIDGSARPGDFAALVGTPPLVPSPQTEGGAAQPMEIHGTTVIAVKYREGVLNLGDRRATAGMGVMFDRADKVLPLDDYTLIAISGSFARAVEIVRYLKHSFRYYARRELQEMSLDGKVSEVSRAIAGNLPMAMQGIGAFIPIVSAYDLAAGEGRIFFYDGLGARFENAEFGAAGSGSERIRGAFDYIIRTRKPFREMSLDEALGECLVLLDIAAELDAATGGFSKILPIARTITRAGIREVEEERVRRLAEAATNFGRGSAAR
jgi:proteasome beta subunit